ncbi:MAG TPA: NUDIX hydrolase [Desulfobacterales bacterium]|jgi:ADP-ribose pyrophosphatase|nr:NUDIX hydrolase [Desulfobacterales bacterium]
MDADTGRPAEAHIHRRTEIYRGRHFSFATEDLTLPNGRRTEMAMVRHPGSIAVVPLTSEGGVVMEHQYRHCVRGYLLEIPAGTLEPGESPLACAGRELEEETGYTAAQFIEIGRTHILPAYSDEVIHLFIARGLTLARARLDPDEIIRTTIYPLDRLMNMIVAGQITDALTILSLHRTWFYLRSDGGLGQRP